MITMSRKKKTKVVFKKYFIAFIIVISLMITFLLMEKTIPNEKSRQNILKSETYYHDYFDHQFSNFNIIKDKHETVDVTADLYHLSMIYLEDNKHPWKSFVEMNKDSLISQRMVRKESFKNIEIDSDYSRYWNGQLIILKPLLSFFTMPTIYNIYLVLFTITFSILLFYLFKQSKLLAILFTISSIIINAFFVTTCDNLMYDFMISMIASIVLIKMYENKNKNIDLLFLIVGMLTVYFDHITCETLTLTLPLFIYIYLNMKDNKNIKSKDFIKYILLWLFGYCFTFGFKWLLVIIHYHGGFIDKILNPMTIRIYYENENILSVFFNTMKELPNYFYPFGYIYLKIVIVILSIMSLLYLVIKDKKNKKYYLWLLLIAIFPLIRYLALSSHSSYHNFFTYRAFLPFVMLILLSIILGIKKYVERITIR